MSVEKIYNAFENARKKHKTYRESKYNKEKEYKELIKLIIDNEELNEAELILKASDLGLGKLYYNAFVSILKRHLGYIDYGEKEGFKTIKITSELNEALNEPQEETQREWDELQLKYESYLIEYIKELVLNESDTDDKVKISLKELYNRGLMELVDYAIEHYEQVQDYVQTLYNETYFNIYTEVNTKQVILWDFPDKAINKIDLNDLNTNHINKIVEFEANIVQASEIVAILKKSVYLCPNCGNKREVFYKDIFENPIKPVCQCNNAMTEQTDENTYANFQEITAQSTNINGTTKERTILYEDTTGVYEGNIRVVGYVRVANSKKTERYKKLVIQAIHIEPSDITPIKLTDKDIIDIKKVAKHPDVINILSNKLLDKIKGYDIIKKSIFLQQIKGLCEGDIRGNIHILLITDPAIGKSVMLRNIAKIPNNNYVNMPTSTTTSLTAVAEKKSTLLGEQWTLKAGVIARTRGTVCIDEFYIPKQDKTLLEPMESQTITVDKAAIHTTLKGDCAYLCACNPKYGKFDPNISIIEQINIDAPTLSRFDLIFPIRDEVNKNKDFQIAEQILKNRKMARARKTDKTEIYGIEINDEFIYKYITYARQIIPEWTDKAETQVNKYYIVMRQKIKNYTARQHEAVLRIAEAHAKARLSDKVEPQDTEEAIRIMTEALKDIAAEEEGIDLGKIIGITDKDRERMGIILGAIKENSKNTKLVEYSTILEHAERQGLTEVETEATLEKLIKRGDIDEPRTGKYRIL